jgi:RNA polymerase-binding transcription factor DksA
MHMAAKPLSRAAKAAPAESPLTPAEVAEFRGLLLRLRDKVNGTVTSISQDTLLPVRAEDEDHDSFDQGLALTVAGTENGMMREINDALRRIDNGVYGLCELTGAQINRARLKAIPYARFCLEAQSEQESARARRRPAPAEAAAEAEEDAQD